MVRSKCCTPITRVKKPEPILGTDSWVIWAAWADRITFEEIREKTGLSEAEVIILMRSQLKRSSFRMWRKRVSKRCTKHRKLFESRRQRVRTD
ncbi:MAG: TIGR03643 family protein [Opitutales bacterium]|nr:TIGR03643 family protein [Opitutales bacterium]